LSWDRQLDTASFRGVPFEVEQLDDNLVRRIREYRYPWRDGADLDDLGREPRKTQLTAIFHGGSYESSLSAFMASVDEGQAGTFVHPILGQWTARLSISSIRHSHDHRDAAVVLVEVIEDGTSTKLPELYSVSKLADEVETEATAVTAQNTSSVTEVTSAVTEARSFAANAADSVDQVTSQVNQVRSKIDTAVAKVRAAVDPNSYRLVRSLKLLAYSCQRLATRVQQIKPVVLEREVGIGMPLQLVAHKLYGDATRASEIRKVNRIRNSLLVPAGTKLRVYST